MIKQPQVSIGTRPIGENHPTYIVAELSANHGGSLECAIETIHAAKEAKVDAIKLQTYTPDTMTLNAHQDYFKLTAGTWKGRTLYDLYQEAHTPWDWHETLFETARKLELDCFSSPFDATAVDFLAQFNPPCYKLASFEITDIPLIEKIATQNKPVIFSTGLANLAEIESAVAAFKNNHCDQLIGLRCVSEYPAPPESFRLKTIRHLSETFQIVAGLSDHSLGSTISIAAVALGASVIEKHFTLSRTNGGPDASFSMEPTEMADLVKAIRDTECATQVSGYGAGLTESTNICFRRSIFATQDIAIGEPFTEKNTRVIRPGYGLAPKYHTEILGRTATKPIKGGEPLNWTSISATEQHY